MTTFQIESWDPINFQDNLLSAICFRPTLEVLSFIQQSFNNNVLVEINGTDTPYDGQQVSAIVDTSSDITTNRENLLFGNGLYVLTLNLIWAGYPLHNGFVTFLDLQPKEQELLIEKITEEPLIPPSPPVKTTSIPMENQVENQDNTSTLCEMLIVGLLLLIIFLSVTNSEK